MHGSSSCFFHNLLTREARKAAQQRGGRANAKRVLPEPISEFSISLRTDHGIAALVERVIIHLLNGEIDPKSANAIGNLTSVLTRSRKPADIEERIGRLEGARGVSLQKRPDFDLNRDLEEISTYEWKRENQFRN